MVGYCEADVKCTMLLHYRMKQAKLMEIIKKIEEKRDNCDDYMMQCKLAKKRYRVKKELNAVNKELRALEN